MLSDIRAQIDSIDDQIVVLLGARQRAVEAAGRLKTDPAAIPAPDRARFVVDRVTKAAAAIDADPALVARIYEHLGRVDQDVSASRGRVLTGDATRDL